MILRLATPRWLFVTLTTVGMLAIAGCGGDRRPITSASSKYEVADGEDTGTDAAPAARESLPTNPGSQTDTTPGQTGVARPGNVVQQPPTTPPPGARGPAGDSPEDLMKYVLQLEGREPTGNSREEVIADFLRTQDEIIGICDRVFAMEVPSTTRMAAARSKASSLSQMAELGDPEAPQRLESFVTSLNASKDEALQRMGFQLGFGSKMEALRTGKKVDPASVIADLNRLIETEAKDVNLLQMGNAVAAILEQAGHSPQAIEAFRALAEAFKGAEDELLREQAAGLTERARLLESDVTTMLSDMLQGKDEATTKFVTTAQGLLQADGAGLVTLGFFRDVAPTLEIAKPEVAGQVYAAIGAAFKASPNADLAKMAEEITASYEIRSSLVGKPFVVEGLDLNGQPLDWTAYQDKIVLVDFWSTQSPGCLEELVNIRKNYDRYHAQGFDVVGVNLDHDLVSLQRFLSFQKLPWTSVMGSDPETGNPNPMIEKYGVSSIPFFVLVGIDGNVLAANFRGDVLDEKLAALYPSGDTKPAPDGAGQPAPDGGAEPVPAGQTKPADPGQAAPAPAPPAREPPTPAAPEPAAPEPAAPEPAAPEPAAPEPAEKPAPAPAAADEAGDAAKTSSLRPAHRRMTAARGAFVGLATAGLTPAEPPQPPDSAQALEKDTEKADAKKPDDAQAHDAQADDAQKNADQDKAKDAVASDDNPYSPPSGLSPRQLVDFIFSMQEKPRSIQQRPGFAAAIAEAADQVLAAKAPDQLQIVAAEAKFEVLHQAASLGDEQADRQLDEFVQQLREDKRERIAKQVQFFKLERKTLGADDVPLTQLPELLDELHAYFEGQKLTGKHLRIASATVHAINRIEDATEREAYFQRFGAQFAASKDKELARYGGKIGKAPASPVSALVGKPLELNGITTLGTDFAWKEYRGKVVVVDFWATWCGPCRRETPHLQALAKTSDKLAVVAISLDRDLEAVEKYLAEHQIEWTNLVGESATEIATKYGIRAIPTMLVVDADGKVVAVGNSVAQIQAKVRELLAG